MFSIKQTNPVRKGIVALLLALMVAVALPARLALADDYSIDQVTIDATVNTDGSVDVIESRVFDFDGSYHGVYWKIPSGYYEGRMVEPTIITVGEMVSGSFVPFEESYSGDDHTYQVDDYGSYVRVKLYSAHSYEDATFVIGYSDSNLAARYDDVSELYWKFVSDGWDEESENVTCTVHLPVPAGKQVEPEENVRAWGHGPLDAEVGFNGNDVVFKVPGVGTSEFAEARITFPAEWLSDATSNGRNGAAGHPRGGAAVGGRGQRKARPRTHAHLRRSRHRGDLDAGQHRSLDLCDDSLSQVAQGLLR